MIKSYIVQHSHWDREWYFTAEDAKVLSDQVFTEVLDELEKNEKINFCLDGQSSIIDEYLEINPDKLEIIQKLVEKGQLFVGPWYTQTDALLVDDESILRNLIIGIRDTSKKYGDPMMIGYLPDTFGFNAQLPTILKHVGINSFMFWRGINFDKISPSPYFIWKGLGNKSVYAINFPFGYMTGLMTEESLNNLEKFTKERLDPAVKFLNEKGNNEDILIPSGIDQKNILLDFDKIVDKINNYSVNENTISSYPEFVEIIENKKNLPEYKGELREPVYSRVHRTIGSVRTKIKLANFKLEQKIIRRIEPLMVIAKANNIEISNGLLDRLWKKVLENQAHDSIGGCVSDNVAEDIIHRIKESNEIADGIENLILKKLSSILELNENEILLVNTDPMEYSGEKTINIVTRTKNLKFKNIDNAVVIEEKYYPKRSNIMHLVTAGYDFLDEPEYYELKVKVNVKIPALGYTVIEFENSETKLENNLVNNSVTNSISNGKYKITFKNNQLMLETDNEKIENFISLVDGGNDGDTYDYSPLKDDEEIELKINDSEVKSNSYEEILVLYGESKLPYDLEDRLSNNPKLEKFVYTIELSLKKDDSKLINGKIIIENNILSHRLRLKVNVENKDEKSLAQTLNGFIHNKPNIVEENWEEIYVEKPTSIEIFNKSVSVNGIKNNFIVFADGLKEYERLENNLYITLFSTTGQLGKPNLQWRPGRASGDTTSAGHIMMPTPLAQDLGKIEFNFGFIVETNDLEEQKIAKIAYDRLHQNISYQKQTLNKFINRLDNKIWATDNCEKLEKEFSLLKVDNELIISSIYPSYFSDGKYIVRISNPTKDIIELNNKLSKEFIVVNGIEQKMESQELIIEPYDYISLQFRLKQN